VGPLPDTVT